MTHKYQNTDFSPSKASFVDVKSEGDTIAVFTADKVQATVPGGRIPMVRASVALRAPTTVTVCGETCPVQVTESVELKFSVLKDAVSLESLRVELNRLVDEALVAYNLGNGFVPPVYADFATE